MQPAARVAHEGRQAAQRARPRAASGRRAEQAGRVEQGVEGGGGRRGEGGQGGPQPVEQRPEGEAGQQIAEGVEHRVGLGRRPEGQALAGAARVALLEARRDPGPRQGDYEGRAGRAAREVGSEAGLRADASRRGRHGERPRRGRAAARADADGRGRQVEGGEQLAGAAEAELGGVARDRGGPGIAGHRPQGGRELGAPGAVRAGRGDGRRRVEQQPLEGHGVDAAGRAEQAEGGQGRP